MKPKLFFYPDEIGCWHWWSTCYTNGS